MKTYILNLALTAVAISYSCITPAQIITSIAGTGDTGSYNGDGIPATAARLQTPTGIAVDAGGNIIFAEAEGFRIRKINTSGIISTIAGRGTSGYSGDGGPATAAEIKEPCALVIDNSGNVFFTDLYNSCVRKIGTDGIISTIAGIADSVGYSGDGRTALRSSRFSDRPCR